MSTEIILEHREPQPLEAFKPRKFWRVAEAAWPGARVINQTDKLPSHVQTVVVLCPLYAPSGSLSESVLLRAPCTLAESRVENKWVGAITVLKAINDYIKRTDASLGATIVFADKGVIMDNPKPEDEQALEEHEQVYKEVVAKDLEALGIPFHFHTYTSLGINFPTFIPTQLEEWAPSIEGFPIDEWVVERVKAKFGLKNLSYTPKTKENLIKLVNQFGEGLAVGFVASYLVFDKKIPELGNVLISMERLEVLFHLPRLDALGPQSTMPTIEIPC